VLEISEILVFGMNFGEVVLVIVRQDKKLGNLGIKLYSRNQNE